MADFRMFYCVNCGTMNYYCLEECLMCKAKQSMRTVAFYFDELDHVDHAGVVYERKL